MKFSSLGYCLSQGFKNIARNRMFSIASVATMTLCIFLLGLFYSITANINYMVNRMSDSLCVKVFFNEGISQDRITSIGATIKDIDGVTMVHYTSAEEAWEKYKERYFGEKYKELAQGYENDNPLKNSASYEVYFENSEMQSGLVDSISKIDGVRKVNSSEVTADGITEVSGLVSIISIGVLAILLVIALFLISNTISIGISVRDQEINIMRLIGARNSFIRAPFVVEGVMIGLTGSIFPLVILFFLYRNIVSMILAKYSFLSTILTFMPAEQLFIRVIPVSFGIGIGLGLLGSVVSLSRHLKE